MNRPYRFVAGAICPKCHAEDRIMVNDMSVKCVVCDFEEFRPTEVKKEQPAGEPAALAKPIRFIKPDSRTKKD